MSKPPVRVSLKIFSLLEKVSLQKKTVFKGDILTEENITVKRPGTGINPMEWDAVVGSKAERHYQVDGLI